MNTYDKVLVLGSEFDRLYSLEGDDFFEKYTLSPEHAEFIIATHSINTNAFIKLFEICGDTINIFHLFVNACSHNDTDRVMFLKDKVVIGDIHYGFYVSCSCAYMSIIKIFLTSFYIHPNIFAQGAYHAITSNHTHIVEHLLSFGHFTIRDSQFSDICANNKYYEMIRLLLANKCIENIHANNEKAFQIVCSNGHANILQLFLDIDTKWKMPPSIHPSVSELLGRHHILKSSPYYAERKEIKRAIRMCVPIDVSGIIEEFSVLNL